MNKLLKIAALAAFAAASTTTAFAGTWSGGISSRNGRPYVQAQSTNGLGAYAMAHDYSGNGNNYTLGSGDEGTHGGGAIGGSGGLSR